MPRATRKTPDESRVFRVAGGGLVEMLKREETGSPYWPLEVSFHLVKEMFSPRDARVSGSPTAWP